MWIGPIEVFDGREWAAIWNISCTYVVFTYVVLFSVCLVCVFLVLGVTMELVVRRLGIVQNRYRM